MKSPAPTRKIGRSKLPNFINTTTIARKSAKTKMSNANQMR